MPFAFTGTRRFAVVLGPEKLSDEEKERLRKELSKAPMAVQ